MNKRPLKHERIVDKLTTIGMWQKIDEWVAANPHVHIESTSTVTCEKLDGGSIITDVYYRETDESENAQEDDY